MIEDTMRELIPAELDQIGGGFFNGSGVAVSSSQNNVASPTTAAAAAAANSGFQNALGANVVGAVAGVAF